MVNRIRELVREPREEPEEARSGTDCWIVSGAFGCYYVDAGAAAAVERVLDRRFRPRWLVFRDVHGSSVRVRTREVEVVREFTAAQRRKGRRFHDALQKEDEEEDGNPWTIEF